MAKTKQAKINQLSTENQNNETIRVVIKAPLKTRKRSKCYDLSSKAQLVIVDGDIKKQEVALTALRQEMAEIIRSISMAEDEDGNKVAKAEIARQGKRKRRHLGFIK